MPAGEDAGDASAAEPSAPNDPWDALARANTAPECLDGPGSGRRISLEVALLHCELRYGAAWVYAPGRWPTVDGCVPVRVVWAYFAALAMGRAIDAIDTARGIGLAFAGDESGERLITGVFDDAFPGRRDASRRDGTPE